LGPSCADPALVAAGGGGCSLTALASGESSRRFRLDLQHTLK